jgi:hypothetical protein
VYPAASAATAGPGFNFWTGDFDAAAAFAADDVVVVVVPARGVAWPAQPVLRFSLRRVDYVGTIGVGQ